MDIWRMNDVHTYILYHVAIYKQTINKTKIYIRKYDHVKICKTLN